MDLRKISETETKLVLGHDPVDCDGFRIQPVVKGGVVQPGKWATTQDSTRTQHSFAPGHPPYIVQALSVTDRGVWTGDEEPPPQGGWGAKLLAYLPPLPDDAPIIAQNQPNRTDTLKITASGRVRDVHVGPGFHDGFYIKHGDVELLRCSAKGCAAPAGEDEVQSIFFDPVDRVRILEFISLDSGVTKREHPFYVHGKHQLFASCLALNFAGYGYHGYGDESQSVLSHVTFAWSKLRWPGGVVYEGHDAVFRNSIISYFGSGGGPGVRLPDPPEPPGTFKVYDSCVWPKPTKNLDWYIDCIFEDPKLDAKGKPTNPAVINWDADPDWHYPTDVFGDPINCIGAVAA